MLKDRTTGSGKLTVAVEWLVNLLRNREVPSSFSTRSQVILRDFSKFPQPLQANIRTVEQDRLLPYSFQPITSKSTYH